MPEGLSQAQNNIEPALSQALLMNGVIHCLPYLAKITQCFCKIYKQFNQISFYS